MSRFSNTTIKHIFAVLCTCYLSVSSDFTFSRAGTLKWRPENNTLKKTNKNYTRRQLLGGKCFRFSRTHSCFSIYLTLTDTCGVCQSNIGYELVVTAFSFVLCKNCVLKTQSDVVVEFQNLHCMVEWVIRALWAVLSPACYTFPN